MKILRFDLLAFGPFTNLYLQFDAGCHGLHVICGPNEAGKSSALRALRQFLYGIPNTSPDNFIHPHPDMRLGGLLQNGDGEVLECIRRKGNKNTLRGTDDSEVIDPTRLAEMLGGVDQESFEKRFGIDYDELVRGGKAVVEGGGDLGEILFAAGSGIADLGKVQSRLTDESEALFKVRGSTQTINKALAELAKKQQELRAAQLPPSQWSTHSEAKSRAETRKCEIDESLREHSTKKSRLERIAKAIPIIARRDATLNELQALGQVSLLPGDFAEARRGAMEKLAAAEETQRETARLIQELDQNIAELNVPPMLLEHRTAIEQLHTDLGSYRKAQKDRPGLVTQKCQLEDDVRALLKQLGRSPQLELIEQLQISRPDRRRIQTLGSDGQSLESKHREALSRVKGLEEEIDRLRGRLNTLKSVGDAGRLRQALRAVQQHGDLDGRLVQSETALRQSHKQAEIELGKLGLWSGTLAELEKLAVPASETIDRFESDLDRASANLEKLRQTMLETREALRDLDEEIERIRLEQDVPTEEDLIQARSRRDEGWQLIKRAWLQTSADRDVIEASRDLSGDGDLSQAFERAVTRTDELADRLRREATKVASKAQLVAHRDKLTQRIADLNVEVADAESRYRNASENWQKQWIPVNIVPLSPREMRSWRSRYAALITLAETTRRQEAAMDECRKCIADGCTSLNDCLAQLGHQPMPDAPLLVTLVRRCEEMTLEIDKIAEQRRALLEKLELAQVQLPEAARLAEQTANDLNRWREQWSDAMKRLDLRADAGVAEVTAVVETIDEATAKLKQAQDLQARIAGIDADAEQFRKTVRQLVGRIAPDLIELPSEQAVAVLHDRLVTAQRLQVRFDELTMQRTREVAKRDRAVNEINRQRAALDGMCREASCPSIDELPEAERRSDRRRSLEQELRQMESQLVELAADADFRPFVEDARGRSPDDLQPEIAQLAEQIKRLDEERGDVLRQIGSEENELRRMDGSDRAAQAQEESQALLAQIASEAEQYSRLRLAAAILAKAVERYREKHQGPILRRASELFAELTLGSFEGLRADYNDRGDAVLVGVRPGGRQIVRVCGMSDGTCDQLYLAVRLAILESHVAGQACIPFIVDDILIKFDDDRAVAALRVLAELSCKTQVIFFTHHEHLVRLAQDNLDDDVLFVHRLNCRSSTLAAAVT